MTYFMHCCSTICSFLFLIGSFYYVAGSYPHANQFYYDVNKRGQEDEEAHEIYLDEIGLMEGQGKYGLSLPMIAHRMSTVNIFDADNGLSHTKLHHHPQQQPQQQYVHSQLPTSDTENPMHAPATTAPTSTAATAVATAPKSAAILRPDSNKLKAKASDQKTQESNPTLRPASPIKKPAVVAPLSTPLSTPVKLSFVDCNQEDDDDEDDDRSVSATPMRPLEVSATSLVMSSSKLGAPRL
jgi:hypothetical protein